MPRGPHAVARPAIVAAAVIERDGCFLITRRHRGVHLEGYWEFPGGKCEPGEAHADCLRREIREELGVEVRVGEHLFATRHAYPEVRVELHFFACALEGDPHPLLDQEMQWVPRSELVRFEFPPADTELIAWLARRV